MGNLYSVQRIVSKYRNRLFPSLYCFLSKERVHLSIQSYLSPHVQIKLTRKCLLPRLVNRHPLQGAAIATEVSVVSVLRKPQTARVKQQRRSLTSKTKTINFDLIFL